MERVKKFCETLAMDKGMHERTEAVDPLCIIS